MTFFLDNTFAWQFAESLRPFGHDIRHLQEIPEFPNKGATLDVEWMPFVGARGWITLTGDRRIATARREQDVFFASKITTFFMPRGYTKQRLWPQFQMLVRAWEQIEANAERAQPGDCYDVQENGKVTLMTFKR